MKVWLSTVRCRNVLLHVGEDERPAFILQNDLLANVWAGLGARTASIYAANKNHFNVIEDLIEPSSDLTNTWVG